MKLNALLAIICIGGLTMAKAAGVSPDTATIDPQTIPLDKYVTVGPEGHLMLEGKRVKYWGWIGHFWLEGKLAEFRIKPEDSPDVRAQKVEKTRRVYDALAQRIHDLGFNLVRIWSIGEWCTEYTPGDGSEADFFAFAMNALDKRGIKVWMTAFGRLGTVGPDDAGAINDPATEKAWKEAIGGMKKPMGAAHNIAYAWDPRLQAIAAQRMKKIADWRNKYKGNLRLGDDPQFAVWELTNEEWWLTHMTNGHWQDLPKFFRDELQAQWADFLKKKYKDDAGLTKAWRFLLPGESIGKKTVVLAPLASRSDLKNLNDANPSAIAALTAGKQAFSRDDFARQRGADVLEFLVGLHVGFKSKQRDAARTMGRGLARVPIIFDTGDHFRVQSIYLHQHGDAVSMCTYIWQFAADRQQPRFPWASGLDEPPRTAMGITPWAEVARVPGKPFFIYETQMNNPSKYRVEYPYRMLALASIQDFDIVCWHLFGRPNDPDEERPYDKPLALSVKGLEVEGVHYKNDEIYSSAMKAAGLMYLNNALKPVQNPTVMTFGKKSLYDPLSMDYGKSFGDKGPLINTTAYRYGCSMQVDTSREDDEVKGPTATPGINEPTPLQPTDQISFDWHKGNLVFDAPSAVSYTGFFANNGATVKFKNGIVLDKVVIKNPEGISYPMSDTEKYVSFALVAEDGLSLEKSKKVYVSLVSTSFNNGFSLDNDSVAAGKPYEGLKYGGDVAGKPPVLVARAGAEIKVPMLDGMKYVLKDWNFKKIGEGSIKAGTIKFPADKPVFYMELSR
jgi:hypothetical protein